MLEKVDFSASPITKEEYKPIRDGLMSRLVSLQQDARARGIGLVVLFEGWDGAGKGGRLSDLLYHLDARSTTVHVTNDLDVAEARAFSEGGLQADGFFPFMQEFWKSLGCRGDITFFDRGWYTRALQRTLYALPAGKCKGAASGLTDAESTHLGREADSIEAFERQLADDGYLVVKFFLHISAKTQRKRLERLAADEATSWRVSPETLARLDDYERSYQVYDRMLARTNFDFAPWVVLNAEDKRRANLRVARTLVSALEEALGKGVDAAAKEAAAKAQANSAGLAAVALSDERSRTPEEQREVRARNEEQAAWQASFAPAESRFPIEPGRPTLKGVDYHLRLDQEAYRAALKQEQRRLYRLELEMYRQRIPLIVMYEGWDAAGKGGSIKRVAQALDARSYTIFPSPAPTKPELLHPHLWRYWTRLPKAGHVGIYDRSWYGRVLVERVEGFASPSAWARAYDEINEFERDLVDWGAILLKFWVEIDRDEQLRRFDDRAADPLRQWKITDEDWRNRDKYPQYREAVEDMFRLTSTEFAPWAILESNDKRYARVKALRLINEALEKRLGARPDSQ